MLLIYLLFALTFSTVLTALFSARKPGTRREGLFIGLFIVFAIAAWATHGWLLPALAAGSPRTWLPVVMLVLFALMFTVSASLVAGGLRLKRQAVLHHDARLDAEAAVFDLLLWGVVLISGIALIRSVGF